MTMKIMKRMIANVANPMPRATLTAKSCSCFALLVCWTSNHGFTVVDFVVVVTVGFVFVDAAVVELFASFFAVELSVEVVVGVFILVVIGVVVVVVVIVVGVVVLVV